MIRRTGDPATLGRVRILAILLAEQRAVTHHEIEERLAVGTDWIGLCSIACLNG